MHASLRRTALAAADIAIEGLDTVTAVIGGAIGAWAAYTHSPDTWSGDWRLAFAGALAVVAAVAVTSMAELILAPLRRLLSKARYNRPQTTAPTAQAVPATLGEGLAQVAAATADDAAARAASAAWQIDRGDTFLRDKRRWCGYEDGQAVFFLAPGIWLHYRSEPNKYGTSEPHFTLLSGDGDQPVPITGVEEIRHRLTTRPGARR